MLRYQLFRVNDGKLDRLRAWGDVLRGRSTEVLEALSHENVVEEVLQVFAVGDGWFAMGMQSLSGPHIRADMAVDLNRMHMAVMTECLTPVKSETLYGFRRHS